MPKVQAASRTLLTHLRFDPGEARRCCLDFPIFDLKNKTPAAFQESPLPVIRFMAGKGGTLQFPGSDQGWELLTLRQIEPEFPLSAALHNHSYYSSARGPQQGKCCANRATASSSPAGQISAGKTEPAQRKSKKAENRVALGALDCGRGKRQG